MGGWKQLRGDALLRPQHYAGAAEVINDSLVGCQATDYCCCQRWSTRPRDTVNLAVNGSLKPVHKPRFEFAKWHRVSPFATVYRGRCYATASSKAAKTVLRQQVFVVTFRAGQRNTQ
jgi:hypothetical protein